MAEHRRIWPLLVYGALPRSPRRAAKRPSERRCRDSERLRKPYERSARLTGQPIPRLTSSSEPSGEFSSGDAGRSRQEAEGANRERPADFRATEPGEGAGQGTTRCRPWQIPWAGWKDILWRVYASVNDNRLLAVAAGVVFYSLLAIFPAIAAFVSLYGLIADASTIDSASFVGRRHLSCRRGRHPSRTNHAADGKKRRQARSWLHNRTRHGAVERQRRNEGDHRRAQRRL